MLSDINLVAKLLNRPHSMRFTNNYSNPSNTDCKNNWSRKLKHPPKKKTKKHTYTHIQYIYKTHTRGLKISPLIKVYSSWKPASIGTWQSTDFDIKENLRTTLETCISGLKQNSKQSKVFHRERNHQRHSLYHDT